MIEEYYNEICKLLTKKTSLNFNNGFAINPLNVSSVEIVRLEQFIHSNNLFDTNPIFAKYKEEHKQYYKDLIDRLSDVMENRLL